MFFTGPLVEQGCHSIIRSHHHLGVYLRGSLILASLFPQHLVFPAERCRVLGHSGRWQSDVSDLVLHNTKRYIIQELVGWEWSTYSFQLLTILSLSWRRRRCVGDWWFSRSLMNTCKIRRGHSWCLYWLHKLFGRKLLGVYTFVFADMAPLS